MPKFKERILDEFDVHEPFEDNSSHVHARNGRGAIERLRDEGRRYLGDKSGAYKRWKQGCDELWRFVNLLHSDKELKNRQMNAKGGGGTARVLTVIREFIKLFEHTQLRLHQLAYSGTDDDSFVSLTYYWLNLYYRFTTYAIISVYLGDKTEYKKKT